VATIYVTTADVQRHSSASHVISARLPVDRLVPGRLMLAPHALQLPLPAS